MKKDKSKKKKKANKGVIIVSFIIILQFFLLVTGFNPFAHHNGNKAPSKQQVNRNVQQNMASAPGYLHLDGLNKNSYGSYGREVPPLNPSLRPYYQIYTFINVKPNGIYQQYAVVPSVDYAPNKVKRIMAGTHLPLMTKEFNAQATTKTPLASHSRVNMPATMKYNLLYNPSNEQEHFYGSPYMIPPIQNKNDVTAHFGNDTITSNGTTFHKMNDAETKFLIQRSSINPSLVGY